MNRRSGRAPSQRQLRVGEEIRHVLAWLLERGEVHDPGVAGTPVTVTEVRVSPDLRNATVFIVPLGGGDAGPVLDGLRRARSFLRGQVSRRVRLRVAPDLAFEADASFEIAGHIDQLLHQPEVARDLVKSDEKDMGPGDGSSPDGRRRG